MKYLLYNKTPWQLLQEANKNFEDFWEWPYQNKAVRSFPACDFHEDGSHFFLSFDLPGINKEDIKINYENRVLTVSGIREREHKGKDEKNHSRFLEKFYGSFHRSLTLPVSIDEEEITAHFSNGVLELTLRKASAGKGREIPVIEGKREHLKTIKKDKKAV